MNGNCVSKHQPSKIPYSTTAAVVLITNDGIQLMLVRVYKDIAGPHGAPELKLCKIIGLNTHSRLEKRYQQELSYIYSVNYTVKETCYNSPDLKDTPVTGQMLTGHIHCIKPIKITMLPMLPLLCIAEQAQKKAPVNWYAG